MNLISNSKYTHNDMYDKTKLAKQSFSQKVSGTVIIRIPLKKNYVESNFLRNISIRITIYVNACSRKLGKCIAGFS